MKRGCGSASFFVDLERFQAPSKRTLTEKRNWRSQTCMNTSSDQSSESPGELPSDSSIPSPEQISEAEAEVGNASKTRLLKRPPLFVAAILPDEIEENAPEVASPESPPQSPLDASQPPVAETKAEAMPTEAIPVVPEVETAPSAPTPQISATVEFLPPPDAPHSASVTLELRCADENASIRYALDAEDVDENGALYDPAAKIFLTQSTTVAARAFIGGQGGALAKARYEIAQPGWQKLEPTEQSDPTTHEAQSDAILEGSWRLAAASVRGKLHAHRGGWREDAYRHGVANAADGTYSVVVVSDGAGSAPLSRVGSNLLCQTALDFLCAQLSQSAPLAGDSKELIERNLPLLRGVLVEAARLALQKIRDEAAQRAAKISDFACTLLILVRREWNGQQLCAALQSGDGAIALWNEDETLTLLGEADHGQQSGETRFITSNGMEAELPARVKFSIRPHLRATMVMTDGIADDYFPETQRLPELFHTVLPLVEGAPGVGAALLDWIDYEKKGSADDRALVVCWRANDSASGAVENNAVENSVTENEVAQSGEETDAQL